MTDYRAMFGPDEEPASAPDYRAMFGPDAVGGPVDFMTNYYRSVLGQGAAMGFGDEIEAGVRSIIPGQGDYPENLERIRGEIKQFGEEHPVISTGAELAGAAIPALASRGRTAPHSLAQVTGRGAATGAGYGAAYGFGTGEGEEERTTQALVGGGIGAALGAALPLGASGVVAAARPLGRMIRAAIAPGPEAERRVAQSIATDQQRAGAALTPNQQALAERVYGQPVTNIERGGETTRALARSAANQSPQARDTLNRTITDRIEGQGDRITQFTRGLVGGTDATTTREALTEAARRANRPAYVQAYRAGSASIRTPELERLMQAPEMQKAVNAALQRGKSRAVAERMPWDDNARNLQFWDYVKRELDGMASVAGRAGDKGQADVVRTLARDLRDELDKAVPAYRGAREGAASFFGAQDALEAGQNFIDRRVGWREAQNAVNKMSAPEKQLFAEGFTDALTRKVEQAGDRRDVVRQIFGSQDARNRMRIALGPQRYRHMEAFLRIEAAMDLVRGAVQGNSTTTRQLVELGLISSGGGGYSLATGDPRQVLMALLYAGGRGAQIAANRNVSNRVADMLISNDPTVYLQGVRLVANRPRLMERLRQIGAMGGVSAGQQGSALGASGQRAP